MPEKKEITCLRSFWIQGDCLHIPILVLVGDREKANKKLLKRYGTSDTRPLVFIDDDCVGLASYQTHAGGRTEQVLWLEALTDSPFSISVLGHEATHLADNVMEYRVIPPERNSGEIRALITEQTMFNILQGHEKVTI